MKRVRAEVAVIVGGVIGASLAYGLINRNPSVLLIDKENIELILESIVATGLKVDSDIVLSLDVASTEFFENNKYNLRGEKKL